jgi:hypothetical protein
VDPSVAATQAEQPSFPLTITKRGALLLWTEVVRPRVPFDLGAYERRTREGPCFICAIAAGAPEYRGATTMIHEDSDVLVFLNRSPTFRRVEVAPTSANYNALRQPPVLRIANVGTIYDAESCESGKSLQNVRLVNWGLAQLLHSRLNRLSELIRGYELLWRSACPRRKASIR